MSLMIDLVGVVSVVYVFDHSLIILRLSFKIFYCILYHFIAFNLEMLSIGLWQDWSAHAMEMERGLRELGITADVVGEKGRIAPSPIISSSVSRILHDFTALLMVFSSVSSLQRERN